MESISLKLIFRSWWRNKTFAVISLLSLAAGITCTNLLISYVIYESRIEAHNPNKSHIIYMAQDSPLTSGEKVSFIKGKIPVQLKDQYPEVEDYLRLNIENAASITIGEKRFNPISIVRADPSFPRFFPYKVMVGDINKALTQPNAIALTEYQAKIFFGNEDPIGKTFSAKYAYENETITYEVADWNGNHIQTFSEEIRRYPSIEEMCLSRSGIIQFNLRTMVLKDENGNELNYTLGQYEGDSTFLKVMKINILQGLSEREALKQYSTPVYINEQYARLLVPKGENPVGKPVRLYDTEFGKMEKEGEPIAIIAGIVENLYTGTLRQEVYPSLTYLTHTPPYNLVQIRLKKERRAEALALLQQTWEKINPNVPFEYQDIYEEFMLSNRKTIELAHLLIMYSIISLLLTAFGLFGMALYAIRQRTKEIGIRKVNGATAEEILYLLNRRFIGWVGIAFAIAVPITWYSLSCWLENFVYRVDISIGTCLLSGGIVLMVTLLTVSRHSYKAASRNPVNTLRSE